MNTPPLLVGVTLLLWGWESGYLIFGASMAVLLEMHRLIKARWEFSDEDFNRLWNLCTVLFIGGAVVAFASNDGTAAVSGFLQSTSYTATNNALNQGARAAVVFIQWMPFIFFPFMLAQAFSSREKANFSTFSLVLRRRKKAMASKPAAISPTREEGLNISYPYFALCLVSTSAGIVHGIWFNAAATIAVIWALWPYRSRRFGLAWWAGLAGIVAVLGLLGANGLNRLQHVVENLNVAFLSRWYGHKPSDRIDRFTSIGRIGNLKQSGAIVLRLDADGKAPELIRESTYSMFRSHSTRRATEYQWIANRANYTNVVVDPDSTTWKLLKNKAAPRSVRISQYLTGGAGFLNLPNGTAQLENLPVEQLRKNPYGVVAVSQGPGLVQYRARYGPGATIDNDPENIDYSVPEAEQPALEEIVSQLRLGAMPHAEAVRVVEDFFRTNFQYTTYLTAEHLATSNETALAVFLRRVRKGHCEYFATATALLLRQAEIPTRYATGYSVQERDKNGQYIIRERHAHAWCLVYLDGHWQDLDTTPASWIESELQHRPFWESGSDLMSNLWFKFSEWRYGDTNYQQYLGWMVVGLIIFLIVRLFLKKEWKRRKDRAGKDGLGAPWPGVDSEFYLIENRLEALGYPRLRGESFAAWLARIERSSPISAQPLQALLQLHYRYRFDPHGITEADRQSIRRLVTAWLEQQKQIPST